MATKTRDKLCFAWVGDFECLKRFVSEDLQLKGIWSQPGGDKKLFTFDDSVIIWRKNKNLLYFDGEKASDVLKELCKQICKQNEVISVAQQSSMQDVCEDLESLKFGQLTNSEAIQAISGSISNIVPVIRQFQEFMDRNKKIYDDEMQTEPTIIMNESFEYANRKNICNDNKAKVRSPIVSNELINPTGSNGCDNTIPNENASTLTERVDPIELSKDMPAVSRPISISDSIGTEQTKVEGHQMTYAKVAAYSPIPQNRESVTMPKTNKIPTSSPQNSQREIDESPSDLDGFIGVDRNRSKTKKFLVTGIDENVKESQILSFLNKRNIIPTYISIFKSRRRGTISSKIHVPSAVSSMLQEDNFWPKYISCKPWKSRETQLKWSKKNSTHLGKYSTYV